MVYSFATADDVTARWPDLGVDPSRLEVLLEDASTWLSVWYPQIPELPSSPLDGALRLVVCQMVRRAVRSERFDGVEQSSESAGPYSYSVRMSNPDGNLFLTAQEKQTLDSLVGGSGGRAGSVRMGGW